MLEKIIINIILSLLEYLNTRVSKKLDIESENLVKFKEYMAEHLKNGIERKKKKIENLEKVKDITSHLLGKSEVEI